MKIRKGIIVLMAVTCMFFVSYGSQVRAEGPIRECPDGFPDEPVIPQHIEQDDIVNGTLSLNEIFVFGAKLFNANFNTCDGQGRPATTGTGEKRDPTDQPAFIRTSSPDSNSCAGCHALPRSGGGGDFVANVFVLSQALDPVSTSIDPEFSNERNTLGMFGAAPIEMLAREMTVELQAIRDSAITEAQANNAPVTKALESKGVGFGSITANADGTLDTSEVKGLDSDLIIKPFHQAGVVISIREFSDNAYNHHHGIQAEERFDLNPDKGPDFDEDGVERELTIGDVTAATIYQAGLGTPGRVLPVDPDELQIVNNGEIFFSEVGCAGCHVAEMTLDSRNFVEPNPFNPAGTFNDTTQSFSFDMTTEGQLPRVEQNENGEGAIVRAYTDLKRHTLCDDPNDTDGIRFFCNEQLAQNRPDQDGRAGTEFFLTRKLWDVGNSAPYGHRGDLTTISEAILMHGGEGRAARDAFVARSTEDQAAIVKFLKTLQVLPKTCNQLVVNEDNACLNEAPQGAIVTSFTAKPVEAHILLEWQASVESNVRGYNVWRGISPDTINEQLNSELIPVQSSTATYQFEDQNAESGITYYYRLDSVDENGTTQILVESPTAISITTLSNQPTSPGNGPLLPMVSLMAVAGLWLGYRKWEEIKSAG